MDTPDRTDGGLPSRIPPPSPALPRAAWDDDLDAGPRPARPVSLKLVWHALRRHWWQALALWLVGSAALSALAYYKIRPTYESSAWLKVDLSDRQVLAQRSPSTDLTTSLETQVQLITSPDVLIGAAHDPRVAELPRIRTSLDPETELRNELKVAIVPKTQIILVSMVSEDPAEAAAIVNAVIDAYQKASTSWTDHETQVQIAQLRGIEKKLKVDREDLREKIRGFNKKSVQVRADSKDANVVSLDTYLQFKNELGGVEIERIAAESRLRVLQELGRGPRAGRRAGAPAGALLEQQVKLAFWADPDVAPVRARLKVLEQKIGDVERVARGGSSDAAARRYQAEHDREMGRYKELWAIKQPVIRDQLVNAAGAEEAEETAEVRRAQVDVLTLKRREEELRRRLDTIEVNTKSESSDALELQFAKAELSFTDTMIETVGRNLQQLEYESRGGARVDLISRGKVQLKPLNNRRWAIVAAAPVGVLVLVLGAFVLAEARAGRVADPDDLPARVRVGVIGVVPPLPMVATPGRGLRRARDEKRRVEEFVQSLDHLRVALCAGPGGTAGRRCLLITSAIGGEGKTTLAAQLAGRCANAGLLTLLVDADLRRPSLGELLEVPEGPGLADVLSGEADPEAAMVVIGNAGGFHLLPAGTAGLDPSRLLQGDRLGALIARFRATFDVVIVDAPPVLAVPDALLLGRWADGAVLAVRHDTSRFPLVERANRRLAAVGISVLGAVVNGVRSMESSYGYGAYHYAAHDRSDEG